MKLAVAVGLSLALASYGKLRTRLSRHNLFKVCMPIFIAAS
jgi:hypothetical protein